MCFIICTNTYTINTKSCRQCDVRAITGTDSSKHICYFCINLCILSVTIVSLLDFNNTGLGGLTVRSRPGPLNFKPRQARFLLSKFGSGPACRPRRALTTTTTIVQYTLRPIKRATFVFTITYA